MKLAAAIETFAAPFRSALARAAKLGLAGVAFDAIGDLSPLRLSATGVRDLRQRLRSEQVALAGMVGPLRRDLAEPTDLQPRLDRLRAALTLAADLGAGVVRIEAGPIPGPGPDHDRRVEALGDLARHGDRVGAVLALTTEYDPAAKLIELLNRFDTAALGVALAPARWLAQRIDPLEETPLLAGRIVQVLAEDARRRGGYVPLGHGDLDWLALAGALAAADFRGWVVIERRGLAGETDVAAGAALLRRVL